MRISLISDLHGNLVALESVLADIEKSSIDSIICLGDIATIGPQPNEVIAKIRELSCPRILGNHDAALLEPQRQAEFQIAPNLAPTIEWCLKKISKDDLEFLGAGKPVLEIPIEGVKLFCYHGSPLSNVDQTLATTPPDEMERFFAGLEADIYIGGHTHIQMMRQFKGKLVINPGSVGSVFQTAYTPGSSPVLLPWAEYAILEIKDRNISVDLRRIQYDVDKLNRIVIESDLPIKHSWKDMYLAT
jgi:putative phosphoesterase